MIKMRYNMIYNVSISVFLSCVKKESDENAVEIVVMQNVCRGYPTNYQNGGSQVQCQVCLIENAS
jgi:hypothetical protein